MQATVVQTRPGAAQAPVLWCRHLQEQCRPLQCRQIYLQFRSLWCTHFNRIITGYCCPDTSRCSSGPVLWCIQLQEQHRHTVIRFVCVSAKFGTCTVESVNGTLVSLKCAHSPWNQRILSSTSVPFTVTTVQVPNLALTHTKRLTVPLQ